MLLQNGRIVQFASRALSAIKQRYSQTEREALAITWACEHFHIYIFGAPFTVFTDHKPLTSIFNNTRSQLSARIERRVLRTQSYDMTVIYRPGHDNPADYLSRHPTHLPPRGREQKIAEEYVNYILSTSTPKAMTIDEVATETAKDKTLTIVIQAILTNKWHGVEDGATWSPIEKGEIRLLLFLVLELASRQRLTVKRETKNWVNFGWSLKEEKKCGSSYLYSVTWLGWHIVALTNRLTGEGRRWKPNDWLGP